MEKYDDREIMEGIEVDNYGDEEEYEAHDDPDDDSPYVMPGDMASDPSWVKHGTDVPMEVGVNKVESFLLKKAIHEADHVVARLVKIISGKNKIPEGFTATIQEIMEVWLTPNFLVAMSRKINANISGRRVNSNDVLAFVTVELHLCFYRTSPEQYFDPNSASHFPSAQHGMPHNRYKSILWALGALKGKLNALRE